MSINYIIYHRNNNTLGLGNHIDDEGDLDPNYTRMRNLALTGTIVDGKFISKYKKKFNWLKECATTKGRGHYGKYDNRPCPICNGIFKDAKNGDFSIKPFYMENVVELIDKQAKPLINTDKPISKWDKLAKATTETKFISTEEDHPLLDYVIELFKGRKV